MRPKERRDIGQTDMFRARLDQIVDGNHALAKLGRRRRQRQRSTARVTATRESCLSRLVYQPR
jgi:hypothetical protein